MQKLTNKEEEIMHILWKLEKAFVKDIMEEITEDKPHYNTLSTIVRNLEEKGYVGYNAYGKTHQYFPIVKIEDYRKKICRPPVGSLLEHQSLLSNFINPDTPYKGLLLFHQKWLSFPDTSLFAFHGKCHYWHR